MFLHNTLIHWINRNNLVVLQNDWGNKENKTKTKHLFQWKIITWNWEEKKKTDRNEFWIWCHQVVSLTEFNWKLFHFVFHFCCCKTRKLRSNLWLFECNGISFWFISPKSNKKFVSIVLWAQTINSLWMRVFCPFQMLN